MTEVVSEFGGKVLSLIFPKKLIEGSVLYHVIYRTPLTPGQKYPNLYTIILVIFCVPCASFNKPYSK